MTYSLLELLELNKKVKDFYKKSSEKILEIIKTDIDFTNSLSKKDTNKLLLVAGIEPEVCNNILSIASENDNIKEDVFAIVAQHKLIELLDYSNKKNNEILELKKFLSSHIMYKIN